MPARTIRPARQGAVRDEHALYTLLFHKAQTSIFHAIRQACIHYFPEESKGRRQKMLGKLPSVAVASREKSQIGNAEPEFWQRFALFGSAPQGQSIVMERSYAVPTYLCINFYIADPKPVGDGPDGIEHV